MTRLQRTTAPNGRRLEASHVLEAPADDAWDALVDTTRWPEWSPIVSDVEASDRRIRRGTTGRIRALGAWIPFRVTAFAPDEGRWSWRLLGLPGATHRVDDLGENRCRIAFELPPTATGYAPVCLRALERLEALLVE
ncbi:SRPBCC family protein [Natronolimnohabitans innermongolicus]|uniref:Polyketide cyclase/dehydrase n=1 Tax=Natronolimnohabitans innermongolicus JCM 12255 TaxID=1227499 RepID=L9XKE1_9EURY|nr:SRPBCC family protein [Natronolimnohabitans innermongolicus]ELY62027.1 polyketide cyclase/dehydrase [Natronolimnohabitans innermongolicus JCM 12255]